MGGAQANAYLMATCYYRNNQAFRALHALKGGMLPQSRYLQAQCCLKLGKLNDAAY